MHASVPAFTVVVIALSAGCNQAASPTSPTTTTGRGLAADADLTSRGAVADELSFKGTFTTNRD